MRAARARAVSPRLASKLRNNMELLQTIALLCQVAADNSYHNIKNLQVECQQSYIHCVRVKTAEQPAAALERCILEKK
jgi:hypothetical protein